MLLSRKEGSLNVLVAFKSPNLYVSKALYARYIHIFNFSFQTYIKMCLTFSTLNRIFFTKLLLIFSALDCMVSADLAMLVSMDSFLKHELCKTPLSNTVESLDNYNI